MIARHWHWTFVAYDEADTKQNGEVRQSVEVTVIGYLDEPTARLAAQDIVKRDNHGLRRVWECASCGFADESAKYMKAVAEAIR